MERFGLQLYTLREHFTSAQEIAATMRAVKEAGYKQVQLYGDLDRAMTLGCAAKEAGLEILGTLTSYRTLLEDPGRVIGAVLQMGGTDIGLGSFWGKTAEEANGFIRQANRLGALAADHGLTLSYHNHSHEFGRLDNGMTAYEIFAQGFETVQFMLDTYWVQYGGGDVRYWIERLKGRIPILHLKDMTVINGSPTFTEIGQGNLCWDGIFRSAAESGVEHFVVEQDESNGLQSIAISAKYLRNRK